MALNEAGYIPFLDQVQKDTYQKYLDNRDAAIAQAEQDAGTVFVLNDEDTNVIQEKYDVGIDETVTKTVDDINSVIDNDTNDVPESDITTAKVIGGLVLINAVNRGFQRLHYATVNRSFDADIELLQTNADATTKNEVDLVVEKEMAQTYATSARQQQTRNGIEQFIWYHGGSDNPRSSHLARNGERYSWETPPDSDGFPGEAFNCSCYAFPYIEGVTNLLIEGENVTNKNINVKNMMDIKEVEGNLQVYLSGEVGDHYDGFTFSDVFNALRYSDGDATLYVNSIGGDAYEGLAIYNYIKELSKTRNITVVANGLVASAATCIPLAVPVDNRKITKGSLFLIHQSTTCACGNADDMEASAKLLTITNDSIKELYIEGLGITKEQADNLVNNESFLSSKEASKLGFGAITDADEITVSNDIKEKVLNKTCNIHNKKESIMAGDKDKKIENEVDAESLAAEITSLKETVQKLQAEKDILEKAQADLAEEKQVLQNKVEKTEFETLSAKVKNVGFDITNIDNSLDLKRLVIKNAGVKNPDVFSGDALDEVFEMSIINKSGNADVDDVFGSEPKNEPEKFKRRSKYEERT